MKKISITIILVLILILSVGCEKKDKDLKVINCKIDSVPADSIKVKRTYKIYYKKKLVKRTESEDIITSDDKDLIKKYSTAYQSLANRYQDINDYDFTVKTKKDKVIVRINIDYDKVDVDKILEIEGKDDNIFTGKKVYLDKLLKWTEEHGITCEE